jgi:hypothetical protein
VSGSKNQNGENLVLDVTNKTVIPYAVFPKALELAVKGFAESSRIIFCLDMVHNESENLFLPYPVDFLEFPESSFVPLDYPIHVN